jgi:hypothetical protein
MLLQRTSYRDGWYALEGEVRCAICGEMFEFSADVKHRKEE